MTELARQQRHVVAACYLGWTLDAFDFFIMVFVLRDIAVGFGTTNLAVSWAITLTLAMRPLGALIFGRLADRFGRRPTLVADVLAYSVLEFASGFAPNLTIFIILRALYGIAMGGEWGVGASLTMESIPSRWRGPVSGLLQAGYPSGYLLASILYFLVPVLGWRGMFMVGAVPALLVLYIRRNVPESPDWETRAARREHVPIRLVLRRHAGLAAYAVVMMTAFNFFSHGTQDIYPSLFLGAQHHLSHTTISAIAIAYNISAILGGLGFATVSQRIGRRKAIVIAALLSLPVLPLWAFAGGVVWLGLGAVLMQFCVQGAWGVIPAHLNELSPPEARGTFPGVVYQLGNLLAAGNATIQIAIADHMNHNYSVALASVAGTVAIIIAVTVGFGREGRQVRMGRDLAAAGTAN